ncbi:unnamed protein product, partial [Rotaria sp. Silwood2]
KGYPNHSRTMNFDLKWNIGWSNDARNSLRTPYAERFQHWKQKILDVSNCARWSNDKMICTLSHDDTNDGPFISKNILLNCVSHARNDMNKFADLRNLFTWQICIPSHAHMIHIEKKAIH